VGFNGNISAAALRKQKIHSRFPGYLETISTIYKLFSMVFLQNFYSFPQMKAYDIPMKNLILSWEKE